MFRVLQDTVEPWLMTTLVRRPSFYKDHFKCSPFSLSARCIPFSLNQSVGRVYATHPGYITKGRTTEGMVMTCHHPTAQVVDEKQCMARKEKKWVNSWPFNPNKVLWGL